MFRGVAFGCLALVALILNVGGTATRIGSWEVTEPAELGGTRHHAFTVDLWFTCERVTQTSYMGVETVMMANCLRNADKAAPCRQRVNRFVVLQAIVGLYSALLVVCVFVALLDKHRHEVLQASSSPRAVPPPSRRGLPTPRHLDGGPPPSGDTGIWERCVVGPCERVRGWPRQLRRHFDCWRATLTICATAAVTFGISTWAMALETTQRGFCMDDMRVRVPPMTDYDAFRLGPAAFVVIASTVSSLLMLGAALALPPVTFVSGRSASPRRSISPRPAMPSERSERSVP
jgi:hypothetical protein